jgi:hypothetical protein
MHRVLLALLLCMSIAIALAFGQGAKAPREKNPAEQQAQASAAKAIAQASLLLEAGVMYLDLGDQGAAEAHALAALKLTQAEGVAEETKKLITQDVKKVLEKISKSRQAAAIKTDEERAATDGRNEQMHLAQFQEAEYLLSQGKPVEASKVIQSVLSESNNSEVRNRANTLSVKVNSIGFQLLNTLQDHVSKALWLVVDVLLGSLGLLGIYALLKWIRRKDAVRYKDKWTVLPIEDKTELGVGGALIESLNCWNESSRPASAGLLRLDRILIPTVPQIVNLQTEFDLAAALQDLKLAVGGVSIGGLAKAAGSIGRWFTATRPWISGNAFVSGDQVVVRLTRQTADGKRNSVTASADKARSVDAAVAAGFKMYYLIATDTSVPEGESANKLREGMDQLREFLSGRSPEKLKAAYETFRDVHMADPAFNEAYLYEGIALDLLEHHDEAIRTFQYLAKISNLDLEKKARYNEGVSRFRKYDPNDLRSAIQIFDELLGLNPTVEELAASPVKALAYAAKANAIAHKSVFWQKYFYNDEEFGERVVLARKREKEADVKLWVTEVEQIANALEQVTARVENNNEAWDEMTKRQLRWAIENAKGNAYLNYAKYFLHPPHLLRANEKEQRREYLQNAYEAFERCKLILPPGVETLANLGTVLIELSRGAEARTYLEYSITLNPQYEYSYYRIAQSWEKENRIDEVLETLRSFAKVKTPNIPGFAKLYYQYRTQLVQA